MAGNEEIYARLKDALRSETKKNGLSGETLSVRCKALSVEEAIGNPEDRDYPIVKGREKMMEATFKGARGQVFTDTYGDADYTVEDLLELTLDTNRRRADFIASLNAIYRHLGLCDKTVHCRDSEPLECAMSIGGKIGSAQRVLLVGFQPRFLEYLSSRNETRAVDLDEENVGHRKFGVMIEPSENTKDAIKWCDMIFATGSTLVNGTIGEFIDAEKPTIFYGVSASAAATILDLDTYCSMGR